MAKEKDTLAENVDGLFFVDSTCINCGVSRHFAPENFGDSGTHAFVKQQPKNSTQELAAMQALLACPVAAIGMKEKVSLTPARDSFPMKMAEGVYVNGFNHRDSYGAHSYFIKSANGNWLVDSPRFTSELVNKFAAMGGIRFIFLTHRDDVADAQKYAKHFAANRIIHELDSDAQKDAEMILKGESPQRIESAEIYFTPGHTPGHMVLLWEKKYLFSGDHFAWIASENKFRSFRDACWYSWQKQIDSVQKMQAFQDVRWVFPGHGKWGKVGKKQFPDIIKEAVRWMRSVE